MSARATRAGAGLFGSAALGAASALERRLLGHDPVYAPARLAGRLARRAGLNPSPGALEAAGRLMRFTWGPALALAWGGLRGRLLPGGLRRGAWLGAGVFAVELVLLPLSGATPPLRRWRRAELGLLALHTLAFGLTTEALLRRLAAGAPGRARRVSGFYLRGPPPLRPDADDPDLRG